MKRKSYDLFPFPDFRQYQRESLTEALSALRNGKSVVLDLPTGVGKSPINIAMCEWAESAYYTTPQRELRLQLREDSDLKEYYNVLRSRSDYICNETNQKCDECDFYTDPNLSCNESHLACTYMDNIANTIRSDTTVLTMSRLLIAGRKEYSAFLDSRDLLVVDEAQSLEDQTAGMHANIKLGPDTVPEMVYKPVVEDIEVPETDDDEETPVLTNEDLWDEIQTLQSRLAGFVDSNEGVAGFEQDVIDCKRVMKDFQYLYDEIEDDRTWVANFYQTENGKGIELKPVEVDRFLRRFFWSKGNQYILSTATVPYRGDEEIWLSQLGLNPDNFEVISYPSPFNWENRTVHTSSEVGQMSQNEEEIWDDVMQELNDKAGKHSGQKGLVHTASYDRAQKIFEDSDEYENLSDNIMVDQKGENFVDEWQESGMDIMCSPSLTEGVDLEGDKCRWQALLKVPYPHPDDARVRYMLQNDRWYWYNQKAAVSILQSVGRAVRSPDDYADFYVLDSSFEVIRNSVNFPEWFEESIRWMTD